MTRKTVKAALIALSFGMMTALTGTVAQAGSLSISVNPNDPGAAQMVRTGLFIYGLSKNIKNGGHINQNGSGNSAGLAQNGRGNFGVVHQEGTGHNGTVKQNGNNNSHGLFQFGKNTDGHVAQNGNGQTGVTFQFGW